MVAEEVTGQAVLSALWRISALRRRSIFLDVAEELEWKVSPQPLRDALRLLKDAGVVDFEEPLYPYTPIYILENLE
jgi:hypothetical protein